MPAQHTIDNGNKRITTTWSGEATDGELIDALLKYQQNIRSRPDYSSYDEIVDFSGVSVFNLTTDGILRVAQMAAGTDPREVRTRLAIVVTMPFAYGMGRMYGIYRGLIHSAEKEVRVFKNYSDALEWIERKTNE